MTQQQMPYYPNGPQQPYPGQPAVQQPYPPQPQVQQPYPPQQYQQPYTAQYGQPAQPQQPLADGSIDAFYSQPNLGGGPGISWKGKPDGFTVQGVVPRDVGDGDVSQEVGAPGTAQAGVPQTFRDGRPKFVMAVPLQLPPSAEYPDGEARLYVRGQLKEELVRAMAEAQVPERTPKAGATITVTLVQRKQGRGTIPQNIFAVVYTPAGQQAPAVQQPVQQQQYQQPYPQQAYAPPVQQPYPPQQVQQPYPQQAQQPVAQAAPPQVQQAPTAGASSPVPEVAQQAQQQAAQAPVQQVPPPAAPQPPQGLTPEQQQLLAQMQQAQQAQAG